MFLLRVASDIGKWKNDHREAGLGGFFGRGAPRRLLLHRLADFQRINVNRFGDVL
jgi:hypothetical protein